MRRNQLIILLSLLLCFLVSCSNNTTIERSESGTQGNTESTIEESSTDDINIRLREINRDSTEYWNEVVCEVRSYADSGRSSTGTALDIDFVIANMSGYYDQLSEDKVFVDGLGEEYAGIINAFDLMYDEATIINTQLQQATPEPNSELSYRDDIDLFYQYFMSLYDMVNELPYPENAGFNFEVPEVEHGFMTVSITIPASYWGEETNQETIDAVVEEKGYLSGVYNDDGSVTVVMSESQHDEIMQEMADSFDQQIQEQLDSGEYPNFVSVTHNEDFSDFTIEYDGTAIEMADQFYPITLYYMGGFYGVFNGTEVDNVHVAFVNSATGELIDECNSMDAGQ